MKFSTITEKLLVNKVHFLLNSKSRSTVFPFFAGKLRKQGDLTSCNN